MRFSNEIIDKSRTW